MMWIILFTNVILLFRNVILQTKTIILLSTKIIYLAEIIENEITLKSTLHSLTFNLPLYFLQIGNQIFCSGIYSTSNSSQNKKFSKISVKLPKTRTPGLFQFQPRFPWAWQYNIYADCGLCQKVWDACRILAYF